MPPAHTCRPPPTRSGPCGDAELTRLDGAADPATWQAAADTWQQLGRPYPAAYAQWRHAEALLAGAAGAEVAAEPLRAAHAAAARLGAAPLRTQLEALARRARISLTAAEPEPAPAPARPHGLTDREADVLRLLATGHTNREIGQQLFISPKTASVHVTSILRKLAVRDRVQGAAIAIRLGLADPPIPSRGDKPPSAHSENVKTVGIRIVRAWSIVPAAVNEREVAEDLLQAGPPPRDLLADKGFNGQAFAASQAARGTAVLIRPAKNQRATTPAILLTIIKPSSGATASRPALARSPTRWDWHGTAHTFWGLLTRTAATIAAHTLLHVCLVVA